MSAALTDDDVDRLSAACSLDLTMFRRTHLEARVQRALDLAEIGGVSDLEQQIVVDEHARAAFRRSVAISHTGMFRDPEQFEALLDVLNAEPRPGRPSRAWSAGCSTGEEVWSLAATLARAGRAQEATVLGSDVLAENVRAARRLRPTLLDLEGVRIPASAQLRFECRDIVRQGAPGGGWDIVLCRNVAIYRQEDRRHEMHQILSRAVRPGGFLMLGRSERIADPAVFGLERVVPHLYRRAAA